MNKSKDISFKFKNISACIALSAYHQYKQITLEREINAIYEKPPQLFLEEVKENNTKTHKPLNTD